MHWSAYFSCPFHIYKVKYNYKIDVYFPRQKYRVVMVEYRLL